MAVRKREALRKERYIKIAEKLVKEKPRSLLN